MLCTGGRAAQQRAPSVPRWGSNGDGRPLARGMRGVLVTGLFVILTLLQTASLAKATAPDFGWVDGDAGQILKLRGMTFVASEGSANEIVLRSERAEFYPDHDVADLEAVTVEVAPGDGRVGFEMRCDRGRLNLSSQDFVAEGHVVGTIEGGRRFEALWVAYDEAKGLLYTDEPVLITDRDGSYRGGGFEYFVHEERFRLKGGASIVQEP
jgi:LPS export ABC transporter protein LptC